MEGLEKLKGVAETLVSFIVDDMSKVEVTCHETDEVGIIEVVVKGEEAGKVIGRKGRIAQALRVITRAASKKTTVCYDKNVVFNVLDANKVAQFNS